jgi:hypothetical protein
MKHVFSTSAEVAHLWANQTQNDARCKNASFDGSRFYSYRTCIAQIRTNADGDELVLMSKRDYSATTRKHKGYLVHAVYPQRIIEVEDVGATLAGGHDNNYIAFLRRYKELMDLASKARRRKDEHLGNANNLVNQMQTYSIFFNLDWTTPTCVGDVAKFEAAYKAANLKELEERKARQLVEQAEQLALWLAGGPRSHYFADMRLRIKDDQIETTGGANIPIDHALKLWPFVLKAHETGEAFEPSEHRTIHLGHYKFNGFSDDILTVGCHRIPYSELDRMAGQLGLLEAA